LIFIKKYFNILYLTQVQNINLNHLYFDLIIYEGTHWNEIAYQSDLIIPSLLPYEKEKVYFLDCWGQLKITKQSVFVRYLHHKYSQFISTIFFNLFSIRQIQKNTPEDIFHFIDFNPIKTNNIGSYFLTKNMSHDFIRNIAYDYFFDNVMVKASSVMALKTKVNLFNTFNFITQ